MNRRARKINFNDRFLGRRQFLMGTGASLLALPPLLSLMGKNALALVGAEKRIRTVVYVGALGVEPDRFFPATDPAGLLTYSGAYSTRYKRLDTFTGPVSRVIDPSFASMYPHMNLLKGLSLSGGLYQGHNTTVLAGIHSSGREPTFGRTVDVVLEKSPSVYPIGTYIPHRAIRIHTKGENSFSFDALSGTPVISGAYQGDRNLFNGVFGALTEGTGPTQAGMNNQKIADLVQADLAGLRASGKLSKADDVTVDRYISSINDLENRIIAENAGAGACTKPALTLQVKSNGNYFYFPDSGWGITSTSSLFDNYIEMLKIAFMCDLTRVVFVGNTLWEDAPTNPSVQDGGLHHDCPDADTSADRQAYGIRKMLKLAQALQATPDPYDSGSTILANSFIFTANELGGWTTNHNTFSMPVVTFGQAGGFIKTGHYVDYTQIPLVNGFNYGTHYYPGRPFKQLLQTAMQAMGVTKSEYIAYGDGNGYGEFKEGINQFGKKVDTVFTPYKNEHNDVLPFIT